MKTTSLRWAERRARDGVLYVRPTIWGGALTDQGFERTTHETHTPPHGLRLRCVDHPRTAHPAVRWTPTDAEIAHAGCPRHPLRVGVPREKHSSGRWGRGCGVHYRRSSSGWPSRLVRSPRAGADVVVIRTYCTAVSLV